MLRCYFIKGLFSKGQPGLGFLHWKAGGTVVSETGDLRSAINF